MIANGHPTMMAIRFVTENDKNNKKEGMKDSR